MAYIVPSELPQTCHECAFCVCKFSYPFWATDRGDECGKQGYYCFLDTQNPRRVMVVDFGDKTKKMEWCPLREVVRCKDCHWWRLINKRNGCGICSHEVFSVDDCTIDPVTEPYDFCSYGERSNNG